MKNLILLCLSLLMGQQCAQMTVTPSTSNTVILRRNFNLISSVYTDTDTSYSVNFSYTTSRTDQIQYGNDSHTTSEHNTTGKTHSGIVSSTNLGIDAYDQRQNTTLNNIIPVSDKTNETYSSNIGERNSESDTNDHTHTGNFKHGTSGSTTTDKGNFSNTTSVSGENENEETIYAIKKYNNIVTTLIPNTSRLTDNKTYRIHLHRTSLPSDVDLRTNESDVLLVNKTISELIDETYATDYNYTDLTNVKFRHDYKVNNESKLELKVDDVDKRNDSKENGTDTREEGYVFDGDIKGYYEDEEFLFDSGSYLRVYIIWNVTGFLGIVANICLGMVFVLRKDMRTYSNIMIMNLTISDILCIVFNCQLHILQTPLATWPAWEFLCKIYFWSRSLTIGSSIYCVVAISLQRFLALSNFFTSNTTQYMPAGKYKPFIIIVFVWILAGVLALRYYAHAILEDSQCYLDYESFGKNNDMVDFIAYSVIPLIIIGFSYILTSRRLKKSVKNMPGEVSVTDIAKKDRAVSSNVLLALTIVFATSYVPLYSYYFYSSWNELNIDFDIDSAFYGLIFINACFNPVALFTMCRKYRRILLKDIICRKNSAHSNRY